MNFKNAVSGAALAIAAAGMFAGVATQVQAADAPIHCYGVNACKGQNDCKTKDNACKGQGVCKGHGFLSMSKAMCDQKGGTVGE